CRLLRRHDHIMAGLRRGDPAFLAAPAHHRGAGREPALEDLVPADQPPPALAEPVVEMADEPALQLILVREAERLHALLRARVAPPLLLGNFVSADVDVGRGKEVEDLLEYSFEELEHAIVHAEDAVEDSPPR